MNSRVPHVNASRRARSTTSNHEANGGENRLNREDHGEVANIGCSSKDLKSSPSSYCW